MEFVDVTDSAGTLVQPVWLTRAEAVHRQLRPHLPPDYAIKMARVFAGGARMALAVEGERVLGVAVYRWHENTADGLKCYVDDLVTDVLQRSRGVGCALLGHVERVARDIGCAALVLDSGVERARAHKFYLREGFAITAFNFKKSFQ